MKAKQTSIRNGVQDVLCPFTNLYISQGSGINGGTYSHNGTRAIDVINGDGAKAPYYAPCDCKVVRIYPSACQVEWQSLNPVRIATGEITYISFVTIHDETINFGIGYTEKQGNQIGNMGEGGNATGVHCHIEFAKGLTNMDFNEYGIAGLKNGAIEFEEACFMDNTNIISATANWKYINDVKIDNIDDLKKQVKNLSKEVQDKAKEIELYKDTILDLKVQIGTKSEEIEVLKNKTIELNNSSYSVLFNFGKLYLCIRKDELG